MKPNTTESVSITLRMHGIEYSVKGLSWEMNSGDLLKEFKRLMVAASFPPSVLDDEEGRWEYVENSDTID